MKKRILSLVIFFIIIAIGYFQKGPLLYLMKEGGLLAVLISMLLVAICVFFPIVPFPVLAGTIGAVFGTFQGVFISLAGAMFGTMCFFFLSRYGYRGWAEQKVLKYPKAQEFESLLEKNSFLAVLSLRFIPFVPAIVPNLICSLSRVHWFIFFTATTIGKIPNILVLSFAGSIFTSNKLFAFGLYGLYLLTLFIIVFTIIYRKAQKN